MPHHFNCCVPGCTNNFRKRSDLQYYRIPKCENLRKKYKILLKNESFKLGSSQTRICSEHFEGGSKLSRHHLPSVFPWTKHSTPRRDITKHTYVPRTKEKKDEGSSNLSTEVLHADTIALDTSTTNSQHLSNQESNEVGYLENIENVTMDEPCVTTDTQTEVNLQSFEDILKELNYLREESKQLREKCNEFAEQNKTLRTTLSKNAVFDIEKYKNNSEDIAFYTGFPDYELFKLCYNLVKDSAKNISYNHERVYCDLNSRNQPGRPRVLNTFQEFTMVMMRLRLGLFERDLAHRFNVSVMTVSRITRSWMRFLRAEFEPLIQTPPSEILKLHMPNVFQQICPDTVMIVDCTEFQMEKPSSLNAQSACYSSYKSTNTMKALLGITPSGVVSFVSELFPGSTSDKEITIQSGLLDKLKKDDEVMADKRFDCQDELASVGAILVTPKYLKQKRQFSASETEHNKTNCKFASARGAIDGTN